MDPFDAQLKAEIQNIIKSVLEVFTKEYVKHYALGLVKKAEDDATKEPGPDWKLMVRPDGPSEPLKTGILIKKGALKKNWQKRYFVVRPDYVVEYYENEKAANAEKPKPKGKMHLCGYKVVDDPNNGIIQKLEKLAKLMNVDISELPKAKKKYSDYAFEISHTRRRCYFLDLVTESMEEKEAWVNMFRHVCWHAYGLENRDPVHVHAFNLAVRDTRWHLGRWGYWSGGGSETQVLSDIISDEIEVETLGKILSKIPGVPWVIKNKIRNAVLKTLDTLVSAGVTPAWAAMSKAVEELRPKVEPVIAEMVAPLAKQKEELLDKIKEGCMSIIEPLLDEHVKPHLEKILEIIKSPVVNAYEEAGVLLDKQFGTFAEKFNPEKPDEHFRTLDQWSRWSYWEARHATHKFDILYDPLWALREIFHDITPWSSIYHGQNELRKILDNAIYTYEQEIKRVVEEKAEGPCEVARAAVMDKYNEDAHTATVLFYFKIIKDIIMPAFNKVVKPAVKHVTEPLSDVIPDAMKQFIDPNEMMDKLLEGIVDDSIKHILQ